MTAPPPVGAVVRVALASGPCWARVLALGPAAVALDVCGVRVWVRPKAVLEIAP